jgi:hypothetical protein
MILVSWIYRIPATVSDDTDCYFWFAGEQEYLAFLCVLWDISTGLDIIAW